jgi:redox-sensitive bicupin YhaK (pirin superfamily)
MSGPVSPVDASATSACDVAMECDIEVLEGRPTEVAGFGVRRILPRRQRRTVGAWCFVDHMGPGRVGDDGGLDIGPHPHIGLQTVTWLLRGEIVHRDSLGCEQTIRPGQLNLMTAGHGVAHAEETYGRYRGTLHGVQLWVAQPSATRDGQPAFEHHAELPRFELAAGVATVLVGGIDGVTSSARRDTDHVGVDLELRAGTSELPLADQFEYGLIALDGVVAIAGRRLEPGQIGYLGTGRSHVEVAVTTPTRALLLGGRPFPEPLLMWWNYVARGRDEITAAHRAWMAGDARFGRVDSHLERIVTDPPPWDAG